MSERDADANADASQTGGGRGAGGTDAPRAANGGGGAGEPSERRRLLARLAVPPGLCAACVHLQLLASPRSVFVRCGLAATDPAFPRYPALPVSRCAGYRRLPGLGIIDR
jgi:hypothetical protein